MTRNIPDQFVQVKEKITVQVKYLINVWLIKLTGGKMTFVINKVYNISSKLFLIRVSYILKQYRHRGL